MNTKLAPELQELIDEAAALSINSHPLARKRERELTQAYNLIRKSGLDISADTPNNVLHFIRYQLDSLLPTIESIVSEIRDRFEDKELADRHYENFKDRYDKMLECDETMDKIYRDLARLKKGPNHHSR